MSTAHPVAKAWDTTTTTLVPIRVTMAKEDVRLDTVRSVDTDTVTPTPSKNPSSCRSEWMMNRGRKEILDSRR